MQNRGAWGIVNQRLPTLLAEESDVVAEEKIIQLFQDLWQAL